MLRPQDMPPNGRAWVHVVMSQARSWLSGALGEEVTLDHRTDGYHLVVPPDSSDIARFTAPCAAARDRPCGERADLLDTQSYVASVGTSINHFHEKLLLLRDRMNTARGRALAAERHEFMVQYLDRFHAEWTGQA